MTKGGQTHKGRKKRRNPMGLNRRRSVTVKGKSSYEITGISISITERTLASAVLASGCDIID